MFKHQSKIGTLTALAASLLLTSSVKSQSVAPTAKASLTTTQAHHRPNPVPKRAGLYYGLIWGVDSMIVKQAESGELIRFSYRVIDAQKAKPLHDKKSEPSLIDPGAGVKLVVPQMEQVGFLRQSGTPETGKSYWMAFSNKGRLVKRGDRVIVKIGTFQADGLIVE